MMITPPEETSSTPAVSKKRLGTHGGTPQTVDRLKKPFGLTLSDDKENNYPTPSAKPSAPQGSQRLYTPQSVDRLIKPFRCPGSATVTRTSEKPTRKRRKVDYGGADGDKDAEDKAWTNEDRLALANRESNKFPVCSMHL